MPAWSENEQSIQVDHWLSVCVSEVTVIKLGQEIAWARREERVRESARDSKLRNKHTQRPYQTKRSVGCSSVEQGTKHGESEAIKIEMKKQTSTFHS